MPRILASTALGLALLFAAMPASAGVGDKKPAAREGAEDHRPNLVLILSDDHRWDLLGAAGNPKVHTPVLDRLAREGVYYPNATVHVSQCHPARATLVTGLPPHLHGIHSIRYQGPSPTVWQELCARPTLPGLLQDAGYHTVLVGKWHLETPPWECGFTQIETWLPYGGGHFVDPDNLARGRSLERLKIEGNTQEIFTEDALAFVRNAGAREKPFFLWFSLTAPHLPYGPNPPHIRALYEGESSAELRPPGFPADAPIHEHWVEYSESVSHLDELVGKLLAALEESGERENTVIVFSGDNGYMMGERGLGLTSPNGKTVPYESSLRIPFLIAGLPHLRGDDPSQASSLDVPPTLLALAGVETPKDWPGRDLVAALRRGEVLDEAFSEWSDTESEKFGHLAFRSIRTHRYKWIDWQDPGTPDALYDVVVDPHERRNLAGEPDFVRIARDLAARLDAWRARTRDPTLSPE